MKKLLFAFTAAVLAMIPTAAAQTPPAPTSRYQMAHLEESTCAMRSIIDGTMFVIAVDVPTNQLVIVASRSSLTFIDGQEYTVTMTIDNALSLPIQGRGISQNGQTAVAISSSNAPAVLRGLVGAQTVTLSVEQGSVVTITSDTEFEETLLSVVQCSANASPAVPDPVPAPTPTPVPTT